MWWCLSDTLFLWRGIRRTSTLSHPLEWRPQNSIRMSNTPLLMNTLTSLCRTSKPEGCKWKLKEKLGSKIWSRLSECTPMDALVTSLLIWYHFSCLVGLLIKAGYGNFIASMWYQDKTIRSKKVPYSNVARDHDVELMVSSILSQGKLACQRLSLLKITPKWKKLMSSMTLIAVYFYGSIGKEMAWSFCYQWHSERWVQHITMFDVSQHNSESPTK